MADGVDHSPPESRALRVARNGLAALITLAAVGWAADVYRSFGLMIIVEQLSAFVLAVSLALVFLAVRARRSDRGPPPWYDLVAAVVGPAAAIYVAIDYRALADAIAFRPPEGVVLGAVLLVLVMEGLRRVAGNVLLGILAVFVAYGLLGHLVPGELEGRRVPIDRLLLYLALDANGVFGSIFGVAATVVVAFLFFGAVLARSGGSLFFTQLAVGLMGRYRGGSAKIAITASSFFGTISGNAVANVATTGVVTIPLMKESGYRGHHAGAIEAVASTGGQLMPPIMGAAAFIMAELLAVPYASIVVAALVPAVLYYCALFIQADLEAAKSGIKAVPREHIRAAPVVLREGWMFPIPFIVVITGLFWLNLAPETAALYAALSLAVTRLAFPYRGARMTPAELGSSFVEAGRTSLDILMIAAAAGFIIGILNITGLGFALTVVLVKVGAGNVVLLLVLAAAISIVLGMGMPTVGVYVLLAALVAPALVEVGIQPIAAHLFVLYFGMMSMTTPPVAVAAYAAATIARAEPIRTALSGVRFGWSAYIVPFLFVASPNLLLDGAPLNVTLAVGSAIMGVYLVSVGVAGYFVRPVGLLLRVAFAVSGVAMMVPARAGDWAIWSDVAGFLAGTALLAVELSRARRARRAAPGFS